VLGIWFGIGYCPVTDLQWSIKEKLGETNLPSSFITYIFEKLTGKNISDDFVDLVTMILFILAAVTSVYYNFFRKKKVHQ
jgi:hypothetical protein